MGKIKSWPRAKGFSLRISGENLTNIEHYAKVSGRSVPEYLEQAALMLPNALMELETLKVKYEDNTTDVPGGTSETTTSENKGAEQEG